MYLQTHIHPTYICLHLNTHVYICRTRLLTYLDGDWSSFHVRIPVCMSLGMRGLEERNEKNSFVVFYCGNARSASIQVALFQEKTGGGSKPLELYTCLPIHSYRQTGRENDSTRLHESKQKEGSARRQRQADRDQD